MDIKKQYLCALALFTLLIAGRADAQVPQIAPPRADGLTVSDVQRKLRYRSEHHYRRLSVATSIAAFDVEDHEKKQVSLSKFKNYVLIILLWDKECFSCIDTLEQANAAMKQQQEKGGGKVIVVPIAGHGISMEDILKIYKEHKLTHLYAFRNLSEKFPAELGIKALPFSMVADREGVIENYVDPNWESKSIVSFFRFLEQQYPEHP